MFPSISSAASLARRSETLAFIALGLLCCAAFIGTVRQPVALNVKPQVQPLVTHFARGIPPSIASFSADHSAGSNSESVHPTDSLASPSPWSRGDTAHVGAGITVVGLWLACLAAGLQTVSKRQTAPVAVGAGYSAMATTHIDSHPAKPARREALMYGVWGVLLGRAWPASAAPDWAAATIRPADTPDPASWQPSPALQDAAALFQKGLQAATVEEEEAAWTAVVERYGEGSEVWTSDLVARALGNRGNARSRQGKFDAALQDYNAAIRLAPYAVDPVLNRGVALEAVGRLAEAAADYRAVLAVAPEDPAAWNNLGNVTGKQGDWPGAAECYLKASTIAPQFAFSRNNYAIALFETGDTKNSVRILSGVLRRYPEFDDARAALAAALWALGRYEEAETNWSRVADVRYRDKTWLLEQRCWPPKLQAGLDGLLTLRAVAA
eukprot:EG_transcript_9978